MCGVDILEYLGSQLGVQSSISWDSVGRQGVWARGRGGICLRFVAAVCAATLGGYLLVLILRGRHEQRTLSSRIPP